MDITGHVRTLKCVPLHWGPYEHVHGYIYSRRRPRTSVPVVIYARWSMLTRKWCSNLWSLLVHHWGTTGGRADEHMWWFPKRDEHNRWIVADWQQETNKTGWTQFPLLSHNCQLVLQYIRTYVRTTYVHVHMPLHTYICTVHMYCMYVATVYYIITIILLWNICFMNAASGLCTQLAREQRYALNIHVSEQILF